MAHNRHTVLLVVLTLLSGAAPAQADPYDRLSRDLALAARKSGCRRVAVLPLSPVSSDDRHSGRVLSERIISRLAGEEGVQVVERALLESVLQEQRLGAQGVIDPQQVRQVGRVLGVEALMTGTFLPLSGRRIEVHTRLIDAQTARILGVAIVQVEKEWEDETFVVPPPFDPMGETGDFRMPSVRLVPDPFRDALRGGPDCAAWERRVDGLQADSLELKARHWAARLRDPGFSSHSLKQNPGSDIRSLETRQAFFARLKELYNQGERRGLTADEDARLQLVERKAGELRQECY
ncbi:MAG: hypothetical protein A2X36_10175 [Elusimicrobia bacterium GWA2_69_24]|nr:MAG: hypothetical protein A2X36_10175 [Elusimicrobia bacterium GWA2_69_24]